MYKIFHIHEIPTIVGIPKEVVAVAKNIITALDNVYGADRQPNEDGGIVVILESHDNISILSELGLNVETICPECSDVIKTSGGIDFVNILVLCNNEYSISILCEKRQASVNLLS